MIHPRRVRTKPGSASSSKNLIGALGGPATPNRIKQKNAYGGHISMVRIFGQRISC